MQPHQLHLNLETTAGIRTLDITVERLIVAGWTGKDRHTRQAHIEELRKLGVTPPSRTPTYMNLSPTLLTTAGSMDVVGSESSGEVECVLIKDREALYLGVGSDHTDRAFEKYDIPASKQVCAKPLAPVVWDLAEVRDHLHDLRLRAWMTTGGVRRLYQDGCVGNNLDILEILHGMPADDLPLSRCCLFGGTFAAIDGLSYGELFEFEMVDPVLKRTICHAYQIRSLPQYL